MGENLAHLSTFFYDFLQKNKSNLLKKLDEIILLKIEKC